MIWNKWGEIRGQSRLHWSFLRCFNGFYIGFIAKILIYSAEEHVTFSLVQMEVKPLNISCKGLWEYEEEREARESFPISISSSSSITRALEIQSLKGNLTLLTNWIWHSKCNLYLGRAQLARICRQATPSVVVLYRGESLSGIGRACSTDGLNLLGLGIVVRKPLTPGTSSPRGHRGEETGTRHLLRAGKPSPNSPRPYKE